MPGGAVTESVPSSVVTLHGHQMHYVRAGQGPALVFLHGVLGSRRSWAGLVEDLADDHLVIAPDLFGHGDSAKPTGDYSLGAFAGTLRDLLDKLDLDQVILIGHSLGGGIAMQFAYLFPDRVQALVLVSSGGLGREVGLVLRAAALPGAGLVLSAITPNWIRHGGEALSRQLERIGIGASRDLAEACRGYLTLSDPETRRAFLATVRAVVDGRGQTVSAQNKFYLMRHLPTLLIWGAHDRLIPVAHAHAAHRDIPGSRLELFPDAGHFPHLSDPRRFATVLREFIASAAGPVRRSARRPGRRRGVRPARADGTRPL
jgi:pimeloyl-ACP methyl ester carboxylesterase